MNIFKELIKGHEEDTAIQAPRMFERIATFVKVGKEIYDNLGCFENVGNISKFEYSNTIFSEDVTFDLHTDKFSYHVSTGISNQPNRIQRSLYIIINPVRVSINDYQKERKVICIRYNSSAKLSVEPLLSEEGHSARELEHDIDTVLENFKEFIEVSETVKNKHNSEVNKIY